jgi:hypothetical protein
MAFAIEELESAESLGHPESVCARLGELIMSKAWFTAVVLGLVCTVAIAKDKDKGKGSAPKSAPAPAAPRPAPAPAPAPKPAPAPTPKPTPVAPAPAPKPAPAPTPAPGLTPAPRPAETPKAKPEAPKSLPNPAPANPERKGGVAGPLPAPSAPITEQPLRPNPTQPVEPNRKTERPNEHGNKPAPTLPTAPKFEANKPIPPIGAPLNGSPKTGGNPDAGSQPSANSKPAAHGNKPATHLPVAPKFETNNKIPPLGALLNGPSTPNLRPDNPKPDADHQHPVTSRPATKPVITPDRDHDHDRDRPGRIDQNHNQHYGHNHPGHSNRSHWSLLILGGAAPLGGGWYGPGYGRTYGGWNNNVYYVPSHTYIVPAQPYATAQPVAPVVVDSRALPQPTRTSNEDFSMLPIGRQRELLLQALNALEDDFARSPNGDDWSRQLQLATTAKLIGEGDDPTDPVTRARLRSVVELFDEVAANPDYRPVSELLSFRSLQAGLREFASEPIGQARGRLSRSADLLAKQLKTWPTGERWRDYLQVPWLVGTEEEEQLEMPERLVRFEKLLAKFDRVKSDDQFQVVSQEPTFGTTHAALQVFVRELQLVIEANTPAPAPNLPELKLPDPKLPEPKETE